MKKRAYISVFDKTGIIELAQKLDKKGWEIISTGKTCTVLNENGVKAIESSTITGFNELLGGKVKSLHPKIFAGILANREEAPTLDDAPFSLVVVNLYPFEEYKGKNIELETLLKNIDIGGVSLLRAGAKNFENVAVV
jgi:phosphoribosylaminoimidazolecarboxamide formyltransferase/IMP cyclohydrolase